MAYSNAGSTANSAASNVITGAGTGAAAGTAVLPGLGTAIGAGAGALAGIFQTIAEYYDEEERRKALEDLAKMTKSSYDKIEGMFNDFYTNYAPGGTQQDAIDAAQKIRDWDSNFEKRLEEVGLADKDAYKFEYGKDVKDFVNPYMGNVIEASNRAVQHSAAGSALGRSTGAAKAISENTAKEYDQLYKTALDAYRQDRAQSYNEWSGYLNNMNQRLNTLLQSDQWSIGKQKDLGDDFLNWQAKQLENQTNLEKDRVNTNTQITLAGL